MNFIDCHMSMLNRQKDIFGNIDIFVAMFIDFDKSAISYLAFYLYLTFIFSVIKVPLP